MTYFSQFWVSFGAFLALAAVVGAWLFRTSGAPLFAKLAIPTILVLLACTTPGAVNSMLGLPVTVSVAGLPDHAELVAFVAHDKAGMVDLWLRPSGAKVDAPRAYETVLTAALKKTLREAMERKAQGQPAMLARRGPAPPHGRGAGDPLGIGDTPSDYILDEAAIRPLAPKG